MKTHTYSGGFFCIPAKNQAAILLLSLMGTLTRSWRFRIFLFQQPGQALALF